MGVWDTTPWLGRPWAAAPARPVPWGRDPDVEAQTLRIRVPAISLLNGAEAAYQGMGHTAHACPVPIPVNDGFYAYFTVGGRGEDPGPITPALAGYTAIPVALSSGNHDREAVALALFTALQSALPPGTDVVNGGEYVDVTSDALNVEAAVLAGVAIDAAGVAGIRGHRHLFAPAGAAATSQRAQRMNPARIPRRGTVVGWYCYITAHTAGNQVGCAISRGTGTTPQAASATIRATLPATTGNATGLHIQWLTPAQCYRYDLDTDGHGSDMFVEYKTDASVSIGFVSSQDESVGGITYGLQGDYLDANGNPASATTAAGIWTLTGGPTGSGSAFSNWGTIASALNFYSAIGLIIRSDVGADGSGSSVVGYYGDFQWEIAGGVQAPTIDPAVWTGTAQAEVRVGWSYTLPAWEDCELDSVGMGYGTQANANAEDQFRLEVGLGGTSNTDWRTATSLFDAQIAAATGTNVYRDVDIDHDDHFPLPDAGGRMWVLIHRGAAGTSTVRFVGGGVETNAMVRNPHRFYNGSTSEYEDPTALSALTPMTSPWAVVGTPVNPGNTSVIRWRARVRRTQVLELNPAA